MKHGREKKQQKNIPLRVEESVLLEYGLWLDLPDQAAGAASVSAATESRLRLPT